MEVNLTFSQVQQKEFDEIDAILPTLWKEGLLTEMECRIIASSDRIGEKKGAVYAVIMSKPDEEAVILTRAFKKMTAAVYVKENTTCLPETDGNEETKCSILSSKNPFLNKMIIKHLFGFLSLEDLKESRLVCRQWNSTAEICLPKRSTINFHPRFLLPHNFMEVSKYSHSDLRFSSYAFSSDEKSRWHISEMEDFFEKWEKNIKEVTFNSFVLTINCSITGKRFVTVNHDVTPLFINPSNITSLIIQTTEDYETQPRLNICLQEFVSIKTLSLSDCIIIMPEKNQSPAIAPHSINIQNIAVKQNGEYLKSFYYNKFVGFSKAVNIALEQQEDSTDAIFDWSKQVFNVNQLHLRNVELYDLYSQAAKGNVEFFCVYATPLLEKNDLKIKMLNITDSTINLNALPSTLEILHMEINDTVSEIICKEKLDLPNLKFLCIDIIRDQDCLNHFSNCTNLVSLEIRGPPSRPCAFNLGNIPKSVKRLRIMLPRPIDLTDNAIFQIDSLIFDGSYRGSDLKDFKAITTQIRSKVLIVACHEKADIDTLDIVNLVLANKQSEKILIGSNTDLHKTTPFEGSDLSKYVDQKSNFYQFENEVGKSISEEEFERYAKAEMYFPSYFHRKEIDEIDDM